MIGWEHNQVSQCKLCPCCHLIMLLLQYTSHILLVCLLLDSCHLNMLDDDPQFHLCPGFSVFLFNQTPHLIACMCPFVVAVEGGKDFLISPVVSPGKDNV